MTIARGFLILLTLTLSACCAPGATQSVQETAFRATILSGSEQEIVVTLADGKRIGLEPSPLLENLVTGERIYVSGTLNAWGSVDVTDVRKL